MAAPHNLSFHSHTTSDQSLQTPDASALLLHASNETTPSLLANESTFDSLEDLLSDAGINNDESSIDLDYSSSGKRPLNDPEFPTPLKKPKADDEKVGMSAGLKHPQTQIPSILSHSNIGVHLTVTPQQSQQSVASSTVMSGTGTVFPLVNPAVIPSSTPALPNSLATPIQIGSTSNNNPSGINTSGSSLSSSSSFTQLFGSQQSLPLGSISLLVQLYKQFQTQGNIQGMQKIKEQLSALQSQLINKSKTSLTAQTGLTGTINITPSLTSSGQVFQPVLVPTSSVTLPTAATTNSRLLSNGPSIVTNGMLRTIPSTVSAAAAPPLFSAASSHGLPLNNLVSSVNSDFTFSSLNRASGSKTGMPPLLSSSSTSVSPGILNVSTTLLQTSSNSSSSNISSTYSNTSSGLSSSSLATPVLSTSVPNSLASVESSSPGLVSPSFVTHMTPSSAQLPLGLQVTPQTQANVLKAVYSYRLQQIQDFLSSLPPTKKPTTTQELRELLIKNNVVSKALPADFLAQIQKMSPQLHDSSLPSLSTTTPNVDKSINSTEPIQARTASLATTSNVFTSLPSSTNSTQTVPHPSTSSTTESSSSVSVSPTPSTLGTMATTSSSSVTTTQSSSSSQGNVSLPGITLETLKTLCRLPESDFIRIPMPAMLTTIVHFLRTNKWTGSSTDLPMLLKQAQEALAKNTLSSVGPSPPVVQATKLPSSVSASPIPSSQSRTKTDVGPSPLSQLMASFGMKTTPTINHTTTSSITNKQPVTLPSHPVTRNQTKILQEQLEKERIANLQKILQSSEEARIAFRFKAHVDKLNQQLLSPEVKRPFTNWQDLILRLLPYHVYREPELPPGAMEKADAVYEGIAGVLMSRAQGLMSRYQQMVIKEEEDGDDRVGSMVVTRLWLEAEKERKEEEERRKKEAEAIAAELSAVGGGGVVDPVLDADPFMLDSDSYDDDLFLSQIWNSGSLGGEQDFSNGIT